MRHSQAKPALLRAAPQPPAAYPPRPAQPLHTLEAAIPPTVHAVLHPANCASHWPFPGPLPHPPTRWLRYDPDEIEEEQRERERRNQINRQFNQFVKRVQQDIWERDYG